MLQVLNLCETPVTDAGLLALSCEYQSAAGGLRHTHTHTRLRTQFVADQLHIGTGKVLGTSGELSLPSGN